MTPVTLSLEALAVDQAIQSQTCTARTVEDLKCLLGLSSDPSKGKPVTKPGQKDMASKGLPPRTKSSKNSKSVNGPSAERLASLDSSAKIKLATLIVNSSLKALTVLIRQLSASGRGDSCEPHHTSAPNVPKPLQPLSPNQRSQKNGSMVSKSLPRNRGLSATGNATLNVAAVAECASTAFRILRGHDEYENEDPKPRTYQLELGMSSFIGKLLSLELNQLATRELNILVPRLDEPSSTRRANIKSAKSSAIIDKSLLDLLSCRTPPSNLQALDLYITSQIQVLKVLSRTAKPRTAQQVFDLLESDGPTVLSAIEKRIHAVPLDSRPKAAKWLDQLAQVVEGSVSQTTAPADAKLSPSTIFCCRILACRLRLRSWGLDHAGRGLQKHVLASYNAQLSAFSRQKDPTVKDKYKTMIRAVEAFNEELSKVTLASSSLDVVKQAKARACRALADVARESRQYTQAMSWTEDALQLSNLSVCASCALHCQRVVIHIQQKLTKGTDKHLRPTLESAVQQLGQNLEGSSSDIEDLFLCVASLRKHVVALLVKTTENTSDRQMELDMTDRKLCTEIIQQSVRFLVRFADGIRSSNGNVETEAHTQRYKELIKSAISPTVEALSAATRTLSIEDKESWNELSRCLRDSQKLVMAFKDEFDRAGEARTSSNQRHPLLTVSNAFWCRYLNMKNVPAQGNENHTLLASSIEPLQSCPLEEQEAGFLHLKQQKLTGVLESHQNWKQALKSCISALETLLSYHSTQEVLQKVAQRRVDPSSLSNGSTGRLKPLIASYIKIQRKDPGRSNQAFDVFCPSALSRDAQRVLLEIQLSVILESKGTISFSGSNDISALHKFISEHYPCEEFTKWRAGIHIQLFHGLCSNSRVFPPDFADVLEKEMEELSSQPDREDLYLRSCIDQHKVFKIMITRKEDMNELATIVSNWHRLICSREEAPEAREFMGSTEHLLQLRLLQDFLQHMGQDHLLTLVTDVIIHIRCQTFTADESVQQSALLCQQLTRLGHCELAWKTLPQAQGAVESHEVTNATKMHWHLAYANCLLHIENLKKCDDVLALAEGLAAKQWRSGNSKESAAAERYQELFWISQLMHLRAEFYKASGNRGLAVYFSKKSTRLIYRAWSLLERQQNVSHDEHSASEPGPIVSMEHDSLKRTTFWKLAPLLFQHSATLAYLLADEGMILESQYYAERAEKVASAIASNSFRAKALILKTYINRLGSEKISDNTNMEDLFSNSSELSSSAQADLKLALAEIYYFKRETEQEIRCLKDAQVIIEKSFHPPTKPELPDLVVDGITERLETLNINVEPSKTVSCGKAVLSRRPQRPSPSVSSEKVSASSKGVSGSSLAPLFKRQVYRLGLSAQLAIRLNDLDLALQLLQESDELITGIQASVGHVICHSALSIRRAQVHLTKDPVFSLLQESTVMYPSRTNAMQAKRATHTTLNQGVKERGTNVSLKNPSKANPLGDCPTVTELLDTSIQSLMRVFGNSQIHATTAMGHQLSDTLFKAKMLLSTADLTPSTTTLTPAAVAYAFEHGRSLAFMRDDALIVADRMLDGEKENAQEILTDPSSIKMPTCRVELSSFQADYIDVIPGNWTAISIAISADHEELRICRMRAHQAPLTLSIPLNRHNPRDCEEEEEPFGYEEGKSELLNIISMANFSAHEKCDLSQKGARTAWWETRAALDARLKDLINNVQNMWIGGFRGIFSQHVAPPALLSRFHKSLDQVLNRHLPSRRRTSKSSKGQRVTLDVQVLELFLGLGNPADHEDLDEALLDLFYFVVDVLQFHGERNAYDEIDFNLMIVETLDALTQYHSAAAELLEQSHSHHTILILDRALHAFPWESLPCLDAVAISRLPSLGCLRDRILLQRAQQEHISSDSSSPYFSVDATSGSYILNPSGDLATTQKTFSSPLSSLTSWDATIKTLPTEESITHALSSRSLYLYFGHGSGGQYVRSRAIRKLEKCAVAMLWGCSSGALTEAGDLESYGPVMAYLHAKSPAVVGTLWDVTDKDIDRFAMRTLDRWGLLESQAETSTEKGKSRKGKAKVEPALVGEEKERVSLDQALAESRGSCILRYLNGAAPVVYGVPVMLKVENST